ncbi:MAG: hypothetical protein O7I42_00680 [Alphaproteobacteria bacterium]|nr:hypothetical protein [Alphaproteobacteria bacterium]
MTRKIAFLAATFAILATAYSATAQQSAMPVVGWLNPQPLSSSRQLLAEKSRFLNLDFPIARSAQSHSDLQLRPRRLERAESLIVGKIFHGPRRSING